MAPADSDLPDLSHLSEEERAIILDVLRRQQAEEQKEAEVAQRGVNELQEIERQLNERKENSQKLIGTQDDAICQICQKTKFADGIGHKCFYCQLRSCARCGGRTTSKNKNIWACSLCQKRQQILARTGKWFEQQPPQATSMGNSPGQPLSEQMDGEITPNANNASILEPITATEGPTAKSSVSRNQSNDPNGVVNNFDNRQQQQPQRQQSTTKRQNTLHRQPSLEQPQQFMALNGDGSSCVNVNGSGGAQQIDGHNQRPRTVISRQSTLPDQNDYQKRHQQQSQAHISHMRSDKPTQRVPSAVQPQQQQSSNIDNRHRPSTSAAPDRSPRQATSPMAGVRSKQNGPNQGIPSHSQHRQQPAATASTADPNRRLRTQRSTTASSTTPIPTVAPTPLVPPLPPANDRPSTSTTVNPLQYISAGASNNKQQSPMMTQRRRIKNTRQMRSLSSTDDEASPANSQRTVSSQHQQHLASSMSLQDSVLNQHLSQSQQETDFSEKDLLRYIYDSHKFSSKGNLAGSAKHNLPSTNGPTSKLAQAMISAGVSSTRNCLNASQSQSLAKEGNPLAKRIRNYLSNPVSWQPSADQRRLIGHMVLNRPLMSSYGRANNARNGPSSATADFGLKVVGGRNAISGRLGAFVSCVRPGSVADTVGQIRAGDEVLEWNGQGMQNLTPDAIYNIVQSSKNDGRLELIVSRTMVNGNDDFLNIRRTSAIGYYPTGVNGPQQFYEQPIEGNLPHSQSLIATGPLQYRSSGIGAFLQNGRVASPVVFQPIATALANNYADPPSTAINAVYMRSPPMATPSNAQLCGRIEISLLYLAHKRELIVSLNRATDLLPRGDGMPRNPYAKLFLLPDRGEKSRRQSKVIPETLAPAWNEHFCYEDLTESVLVTRVLEVTVWDYDSCESHLFLGETLIDLAVAPLNNQPFSYALLDMDDENPIRIRLRQRRYSSMTPPIGGGRSRSQTSHYRSPRMGALGRHLEGDDPEQYSDGATGNHRHSMQSLPTNIQTYQQQQMRSRRAAPMPLGCAWPEDDDPAAADWTKNDDRRQQYGVYDGYGQGGFWPSDGGGRLLANGYLSDQDFHYNELPPAMRTSQQRQQQQHLSRDERQNRKHQHNRHNHRDKRQRPRSATALRAVPDYGRRPGDSTYFPYDLDFEAGNEGQSFDANEYPVSSSYNKHRPPKKTTRQQKLQAQETAGGYGSDGSETLSVNSAQSMQNRTLVRQQQQRLQQQQQQLQNQPIRMSSMEADEPSRANLPNNVSGHPEDVERQPKRNAFIRQQSQPAQSEFYDDSAELQQNLDQQQSSMSGGPKGGTAGSAAALSMKERKKSLMTRLIPGRTGPNDASKRLGFARSEEVGVPEALTIPEQNPLFIKQASKESNDSSDNWLPILPDKPLGHFVENLGPGQIVGRQVLASPILGELQIGIAMDPNEGILVDIIQAKNLVHKHGSKVVPVTYVKAYLMEGKSCVAKAKTQPGKAKSMSPQIQQKMAFAENPKNKMLQLSVLGDYGRMERKSFMGVVQISLDELQLGPQPLVGWYKLFHSSSISGAPPPATQENASGMAQ